MIPHLAAQLFLAHMADPSDSNGLLRAVGLLLAEGLLAREDDPQRAVLSVEGRGYRYMPRFWARTGVLEVAGAAPRVGLRDDADAARARGRIAAEWMTAGAPCAWARREAEVALWRVRVRSSAHAVLP